MRQLDHAAVQTLQAAFREVSLRADRLREWTDLEQYLRSVEARFDAFSNEVRPMQADSFGPSALKLIQLWGRCQDTDLIDLQSFAQGVEHINQPLATTGGGNPALLGSQFDVSSLIQLGDQIRQALDSGNFPEFKKACTEFQRRLSVHIADRRIISKKEVRELCDLTVRLRMQLEG